MSSFGSLSQLNDAEAAPAAIGVFLGFHSIELDKYKLLFFGPTRRCSIGSVMGRSPVQEGSVGDKEVMVKIMGEPMTDYDPRVFPSGNAWVTLDRCYPYSRLLTDSSSSTRSFRAETALRLEPRVHRGVARAKSIVRNPFRFFSREIAVHLAVGESRFIRQTMTQILVDQLFR